MAQADRSPGEQSSETRERKQPVEHRRAGSSQVDIGKGTESDDRKDGEQRAVGTINVGENLGSISLLSKSSEGTRTAVDAGHTEGKDGDENDDVHERVETLQVGVLADQHEGRSVDVNEGVGAQKVVVVVRDQETDEEETEDVKEGDTPEHLLDGARKRLDGVLGLSSRQTDELSSGEGESSRDEAGAETAETVGESSRVVPERGAGVVVVPGTLGAAAENHDEADDEEDDGGAELEGRCPEFFFGVAEGAPYVDDDDGY